ncbi:transposase [Paenochrobactrum sp. BZR 588]|uniref:IS110 family transposase n=1 Tax=Paenochrobactrum sp. BZR 588 TaxID=3378076 RepID=UPI0035BBADAF
MCLPDERSTCFANSTAGLADLLVFLSVFEGIECLVLEPIGGYDRYTVEALQAAQLPIAKVNAKQIRQFARACVQLSKTDKIDPFILADYARRIETRILSQRSSWKSALADLPELGFIGKGQDCQAGWCGTT